MEPRASLRLGREPRSRRDCVGKAPPCAPCMDFRPRPPPQFAARNRAFSNRNRENKLREQGSFAVVTQSCPGPRSVSAAHVEIAWRRLGAGRLASAALNDPFIGSPGKEPTPSLKSSQRRIDDGRSWPRAAASAQGPGDSGREPAPGRSAVAPRDGYARRAPSTGAGPWCPRSRARRRGRAKARPPASAGR
jgi:hypothetical protein